MRRLFAGVLLVAAAAGGSRAQAVTIPPQALHFRRVLNARATIEEYRGRRALKLTPTREASGDVQNMLAILDQPRFRTGTITVDVAGQPRAGMPADSRGFIGLAFRTGDDGQWSEVFYLRPTNGRANDELRRNHSTQYVADPEYPWNRIRKE